MSHLPYERPPIRPCPPLLPLLGIGALVALGCKEPAELPKREPPTVRVSQPLAQTVTTYLEETGTTEAVQRADVRARVTGFLEQVKFEAGAEVAAGDELYVIEPAVKVSEAALDQAKIEEDYTSVKAPISGRIGKTLVKQGNLVEKAGATLLTTIVNYDNIYANFNISERDLLTLMNRRREDGQKRDLKSVQVLLSRATDSGFPFQGHLDYADLAVDESTGTYAVRAVFPNPNEQILPGLFVRIRVVGRQKDVLMVPETAIRADQAGRHLLVVGGENVVERRDVDLGIQRRGYRLTPELKQWCAAELKISAQAPVNEFRDAVAQAIAATFFSVLLVPSFFVVFQTLAELRRAREPEPQAPSSMTVCDSAARGLRL